MARYKIPITVLGADGRPLAGASCTVRRRSDSVAATVYAAETGAGTISNPVLSDASGRVAGWVDRGAYECVISQASITPYIEPLDAVPGGDKTLDGGVLADRTIGNRMIDATAIPFGVPWPWLGAAAPPGGDFLMLDGATVSRATYADLFALIGVQYGAGDGTTTFKLPDWRSRTPLGAGQGPGLTNRPLGATGGAERVQLAAAESGVGPHVHTTPFGGEDFLISSGIPGFVSAGQGAGTGVTTNGGSIGKSGTSSASAGAQQSHENMHPWVACNWIVRAR